MSNVSDDLVTDADDKFFNLILYGKCNALQSIGYMLVAQIYYIFRPTRLNLVLTAKAHR